MEEQTKTPDIFGLALNDYVLSNSSENIIVHSSIAQDDEIPLPYLLRTFNEMPEIEQKALELSVGKTLDVGCGAGSHLLWLKENRGNCEGLDTSKGAVTLSRKRTSATVHHKSILEHTGSYNTVLILMNGTGIFEKVSRIDRYLQHLKKLLLPEGQILVDGSDIRYMFEDEDGGFWVDTHRDYYGEVTYRLSYKKYTGASFDWLYLDYDTLAWYANKNGLCCEQILEGDHYDYLARLTQMP